MHPPPSKKTKQKIRYTTTVLHDCLCVCAFDTERSPPKSQRQRAKDPGDPDSASLPMCTEASVPHISMTTACQPQQQEKEGPRWRIKAKGQEPQRTITMHCKPQPRALFLTPENCLVPGAVGRRAHGQHNDCKVPRSSDCKIPQIITPPTPLFDS